MRVDVASPRSTSTRRASPRCATSASTPAISGSADSPRSTSRPPVPARSTCCSWAGSTTGAVRRWPSWPRTCGGTGPRYVPSASIDRSRRPHPVWCSDARSTSCSRRRRCCVNLHRDRSADLPVGVTPPAYFEWARMIEAMANGCVVVTEPSEGFEPLEPGRHFVESSAEEMPAVVEALLADRDRVEQIRTDAYRAVMVDLALGPRSGTRARRARTRRAPPARRPRRRHRPDDRPVAPRWQQGGPARAPRTVPSAARAAAAGQADRAWPRTLRCAGSIAWHACSPTATRSTSSGSRRPPSPPPRPTSPCSSPSTTTPTS